MTKWLVRIALAAAALGLFQADLRAEPDMSFTFNGTRTGPADEFEHQMRDGRAKVRAWWGATFEEPISVVVEDKRGPSMALVPAWRGERGRMLFTAGTVNAGRAATHHELIHVYAPNASRFLAEGLATYGHDLLGGRPAHPNFGRGLDELAAKHATAEAMGKLERAATPLPLESIDENAYVLAGSFVKFLIERHGMDKFRSLYELTPLISMRRNPGEPERWQQIYGTDFAALVTAWRAVIRASP